MDTEALKIEYSKLLAWIKTMASNKSISHSKLREALAARRGALMALMRSEGNR